MGDYSMLDLFRQEVETQVTSLKQSLTFAEIQDRLSGLWQPATDRFGMPPAIPLWWLVGKSTTALP